MNVGLVLLPMWDATNPPLGINYVAESLRLQGHQVKLFDYNLLVFKRYNKPTIFRDPNRPPLWNGGGAQDWQFSSIFKSKVLPMVANDLAYVEGELLSQIKKNKLSVLGFSVFSTNCLMTKYFIKRIRKKISKDKLKIFIGGVELFNNQWPEFLNEELIDAAIVGEGEVAASKLLNAWEENLPIINIPGVVSKATDGNIMFAQPIPIDDLTELPILRFSDCLIKEYDSGIIPLQMTRGCYARCAFCDEVVFGAKYRSRTAEHIFLEMKKNSETHQCNNFFITDSAINPLHPETEKLMDLIIESKLPFRFSGNCRIAPNLTPHMLEKMHRAGCRQLFLGLESASPKILELMNKGIKVEWAIQNLRDCHEAGILTSVNLIIGFPGETEEDFEKTLKFIYENKAYIETVNTGMGMAITYNSTVWNNPKRFNIKTNADGSIYLGPNGWETIDGQNNSLIRDGRLFKIRKMLKEQGVRFTPCFN